MRTAVDIAIAIVVPVTIGTTFATALHEAGRPHLLCDGLAHDQLTLEDGHRHWAVPRLQQTNPDQIDRQVDLVFHVVKVAQSETAEVLG